MKVLITGGAGFIGSHLAEAYLDRGDNVYIIDDLSTGSIDNIEHLRKRSGFNCVIDTIMNEPLMAELVGAVDVIFHLAAAVGVKLIVENPVRTIETNVRGTELILKLASRNKKTVMISSTSEVYGKHNGHRFTEDDDLVLGPTCKARWSYAASKIVDESLALAYWKEIRLPTIIIRLFNTVGSRQTGRYGMVIPRFVYQALTGQPITVYGDGRQTRTFTHVKDAVWAMIELVEHYEALGEIFNVGGDGEISIESLAQLVKEVLNSPSEIIHIPYEEAYEEGFEDMMKRSPDITKIQRLIDYNPRFNLHDVITDVAEYQRCMLLADSSSLLRPKVLQIS
jgi:UDP-glucose 4-epimerase